METTTREDFSPLDGYSGLVVDARACPPALIEDLRGILAARWFSASLRHLFEETCGGPAHGPLGTFDGVVAHAMPGFWRRTGATSLDVPLWKPDGRHPVGKWYADTAASLFPLPDAETLDATLRRHGIEGRELAPVMKQLEDVDLVGILVHRLRRAALPEGVSQDATLPSRWRHIPA